MPRHVCRLRGLFVFFFRPLYLSTALIPILIINDKISKTTKRNKMYCEAGSMANMSPPLEVTTIIVFVTFT